MTNEKRQQALAELQEDGERMERFDLKTWIKEPLKNIDSDAVSLSDSREMIAKSDGRKEGFIKALDLVMEKLSKAESNNFNYHELEQLINKLRGL